MANRRHQAMLIFLSLLGGKWTSITVGVKACRPWLCI